MKKYLFILLLTIAGYGQTYQNPTFGTIKTKTSPTVTSVNHLATVEASGVMAKIVPTSNIIQNASIALGATVTDALNILNTGKVGGSGTSGQVSFWSGASSQSGDASFLWDNANKRLSIGGAPVSVAKFYVNSNTAASYGTYVIDAVNSNASGQSIISATNNANNVGLTIGSNNTAYVTTTDYGKANDTFIRSSNGGKDLNVFNASNTDGAIRFYTGNLGSPLEKFNILYNGDINAMNSVSNTNFNVVNSSGFSSQITASSNTSQVSQLTLGKNVAGVPTARWILRSDATTETGSNAGSDFRLISRSDSGAMISDVLFVKRSTGSIGINNTSPNALYKLDVTGVINATSYNGDATLTGNPKAPTPTAGDNDTSIATTAFVTTADNLKANIASPTFTGTPTAPTATAGTNNTEIANTAFVTSAIATAGAGYVNTTGNQTIAGIKTFSESAGVAINAIASNSYSAILGQTSTTSSAIQAITTSSTGSGVLSNIGTSGSGFAFVGQNNGTNTFTVNKTGDIVSNTVTLYSVLKLKAYTVSTLPAGTVGDMAYVTDATAPTYNGTLTGGGAVKIPVFYDGTAWKAH